MKRWAGRVVSAAAVAILLLTTGCAGFFVYPGSLPGGGSGTEFVYAINQTAGQNAGTLVGYSIGTNTLTAVAGSPQSLSFIPTAIAVNRTNTLLFVAGGNVINTYAIGSGGALTLLTANNLIAGEDAIDISPDGQWLLGLEAGTPSTEAIIDEFSINSSSGLLTQITGNRVIYNQGTSITPSAIKFAPNGQLVFLALGTGGDLVYTFDTASSSGLLTLSQTIAVPSQTADNALTVSLNNSYVYFARSSGSGGSVVACPITSTTVTTASCTSVSAGVQPFSVVVNTTGTDVYVANQGDGTISGYSGAATGNLTALSPPAYSVGSDPAALAVDHSGAYLIAVSNTASGDNLNMYSFNSTGNLVLSTQLNAGSGPVGLAATY